MPTIEDTVINEIADIENLLPGEFIVYNGETKNIKINDDYYLLNKNTFIIKTAKVTADSGIEPSVISFPLGNSNSDSIDFIFNGTRSSTDAVSNVSTKDRANSDITLSNSSSESVDAQVKTVTQALDDLHQTKADLNAQGRVPISQIPDEIVDALQYIGKVTTEEDLIELRQDAQAGLNPGEVSGILINNYDGNGNDGEIVLDNTGTLRVGDTASLEPVATRDEATNFTDGHLTTWDATNNRLVDAGASISDILSAGSTSTIEGWANIITILGTPTDLNDLISKAQTYMQANNFSEMRLTAYTTKAQGASYISLTWTTNVVFDLQVTATNGFKARFFDNTHFGIYNNNNWDVNIINDVIVKDANGELTVTSNDIQSNTNLEIEATGDITVAPTNAFVIPTTAPSTLVPGAIWIA